MNDMTKSRSYKPHYANTFSKLPSDDYSPWPISCGELASLIDLGISDDRIARYFGVEQVKVSALRAYDGLVDTEHPEPDLVRNLIPEDECCSPRSLDNADAHPWRCFRKTDVTGEELSS